MAVFENLDDDNKTTRKKKSKDDVLSGGDGQPFVFCFVLGKNTTFSKNEQEMDACRR